MTDACQSCQSSALDFRPAQQFWAEKDRIVSWGRCEFMALPAKGEVAALAESDVLQRAKEKVGAGRGLALTWDNNEAIRQRMRGGYNLVIHYDAKFKRCTNSHVEKIMANVHHNTVVLEPVCRLSGNGVVPKDELLHEVKQIFSMYNVLASDDTLRKQAWAIRHLIHVLKQSVKGVKGEPTRIKRCPKDSTTCPTNMPTFQGCKVS